MKIELSRIGPGMVTKDTPCVFRYFDANAY